MFDEKIYITELLCYNKQASTPYVQNNRAGATYFLLKSYLYLILWSYHRETNQLIYTGFFRMAALTFKLIILSYSNILLRKLMLQNQCQIILTHFTANQMTGFFTKWEAFMLFTTWLVSCWKFWLDRKKIIPLKSHNNFKLSVNNP